MKRTALICFALLFLAMASVYVAAQEFQPEHVAVDTQCVTDDENFTKLFDVLAFGLALFGFLLLPSTIPLLPAVANRWEWADPVRRWRRFALIACAVFVLVVFLPPQLARVSAAFRPFGLVLFHSIGNIRLEYLDCDLHTVPKDYGFLFFFRWSPGFDLMIRYWWAQLTLFALYAVACSGVYFGIVAIVARRRLEALAR